MAESDEVAGLVIKVDATGAASAKVTLDEVTAAAGKNSTAVDRLGATSVRASGQTKQLAAATVDVSRAEAQEITSTEQLLRLLAEDASASNLAATAQKNLAATIEAAERSRPRVGRDPVTGRAVSLAAPAAVTPAGATLGRDPNTGRFVSARAQAPAQTAVETASNAAIDKNITALAAQVAADNASTVAIERNVAALATQAEANRLVARVGRDPVTGRAVSLRATPAAIEAPEGARVGRDPRTGRAVSLGLRSAGPPPGEVSSPAVALAASTTAETTAEKTLAATVAATTTAQSAAAVVETELTKNRFTSSQSVGTLSGQIRQMAHDVTDEGVTMRTAMIAAKQLTTATQEQIDVFGKGPQALAAYKAAQQGIATSKLNLDPFNQKLQEEIDLYGKGPVEVAAYRAALSGATQEEIKGVVARTQKIVSLHDVEAASKLAAKAEDDAAKIALKGAEAIAKTGAAHAGAVGGIRAAGNAIKLTSTDVRELITVPREIIEGRGLGRIVGSLSILAQQGGLTRIAMAALSSPIVILGGIALATAGSMAFLAHAAEKTAESVKLIETALTATGKSALLSGAQIRQSIDDVQKLHGVNKDEATAAISALARAPFINKAQFDQAKAAIGDLAAALGVKVPEAAKVLASALENPIEGLHKLQQAHIHLTPDQEVTITALHRQGKEAEATAALLNALSGNLRGLSENALTPLQKASRDLGNAWHGMTTSLAESGPVQTALGALTSLLNGMSSALNAVKDAQKWLDDHPGIARAVRIGTSLTPSGAILNAFPQSQPSAAAQAQATLGGTAVRPGQQFSGSPADQAKAKLAAQSVEAARAFEIEFHRVEQLAQGYETAAQRIQRLVAQRDVLQKGLDKGLVTSPIARREVQNQIAGINEQIGKKDDHGFRAEELRLQLELNNATEQLDSILDGSRVIEGKALTALAQRLATEKDLNKIGAERVAQLVKIADATDLTNTKAKALNEAKTITASDEGVRGETARLEGNVAESALDTFHKKYDAALAEMQARAAKFGDAGIHTLDAPLEKFRADLTAQEQLLKVTSQTTQTEQLAALSEKANATANKTAQVEEAAGYISHAEAINRVIAANDIEADTLQSKIIPAYKEQLEDLIKIGEGGTPAAEKLRDTIGELDLKILELRTHTSELKSAFEGAFKESVASSLDGIIEKTETANQAVKNIEKSLEHAFVSTFTKGFVDDLATLLFKPGAPNAGAGAGGAASPGGFLGAFPSLANFIGVTPAPVTDTSSLLPKQNQGRGGIGNIVNDVEGPGAGAAPIAAAFTTGSTTVVAALTEAFATGAATLSGAISAALASGAGSSGGLSSLGTLASTSTPAPLSTEPVPFALGGYTGSAAPGTPAGIVHGQEFVHRAEVVKQPGALSFLSDFNKRGMQAVASYAGGGFIKGASPLTTLRGYADGGGVGYEPIGTNPPPPLTQQQFSDYVNAEAAAGIATQPGSGLAGSGIFHGSKDNSQKAVFALVMALSTIAAKTFGGSHSSVAKASGSKLTNNSIDLQTPQLDPQLVDQLQAQALSVDVSGGAPSYAGTLIDNGPGRGFTPLVPGVSILPNGTVYQGTLQDDGTLLQRQFYPGGYTGPGSKFKPAGIVHAGEFVHRQEVVAQPGALSFLTAFNERGMSAVANWRSGRGYAVGGPVLAPRDGEKTAPASSAAVFGHLSGYALGGFVAPGGPLEALTRQRASAAEIGYAAGGYVAPMLLTRGYVDGGPVLSTPRAVATAPVWSGEGAKPTKRYAGQGAAVPINMIISPDMAHKTLREVVDEHLSDSFAKRG